MIGLINNIAAPVVPIKDARIAPAERNRTLIFGFASISPVRKIPPVIVNKDPSRIIKGT